jgi:uncharacterized glyoxalase superfamily protein PhnB
VTQSKKRSVPANLESAADAIAFYKKALGAVEVVRLADSTGKVMHAELLINDSRIMLANEFPDMGYRSPQSYGGSAVADQFDGDRRGTVTVFSDTFGCWHLERKISRRKKCSADSTQ